MMGPALVWTLIETGTLISEVVIEDHLDVAFLKCAVIFCFQELEVVIYGKRKLNEKTNC